MQVWDFSRQVHEDLSNYDPCSAWPVLLDEFVDHMCKQKTRSRRCASVKFLQHTNISAQMLLVVKLA